MVRWSGSVVVGPLRLGWPDGEVPSGEDDPPPIDVPLLSLLEVMLYVAGIIATGLSVAAVVWHLAKARSHAWARRNLLILVVTGFFTLIGAALLLGPVTVTDSKGSTLTCAYGEPSPAVAQLRGVPDDSSLSQRQRDCRNQARLRVVGAAVFLLIDLTASMGVIIVGRQRAAKAK